MPRWAAPIAVVIFSVSVVAGAFAWVENHTAHTVAPSVELAGRPVGEMHGDELIPIVTDLADSIERTPVSIRFAGRSIETTAGAMGVVVGRQATVDAVMATGRQGSFPQRMLSWLGTLSGPRPVAAVWSLDLTDSIEMLEADPTAVVAEPEEPRLELVDGAFSVIAGVEGLELDRDATAELFSEAFEPETSVVIAAPTDPIPTMLSNADAVAFTEHLNEVTAGGVAIQVSQQRGRISEGSLREAIQVDGWPNAPTFSFRPEALRERLFRLFSEVSEPGSDPVMEVVDGVPVLIEAGTPPRRCCDPRAGDLLVEALDGDTEQPVQIPTVASEEAEAVSTGADVVEVVGEFTTEHQCCESRVENIHRIADLVRGVYLQPDELFSINSFVGRRTVEKGFVSAGVIEQGRFTDDVGGGISQFATTFFNAAFFAGLDLVEYQSHSIYIPRYPYGREATLSYPKPDLVVRNTTEYPVLVWTSYTDSSITVSLYSRRHLDVVETGQVRRPARRCTQVETFRERTYPDGSTIDDSVIALYRPAEGLDCNGNPTPDRR